MKKIIVSLFCTLLLSGVPAMAILPMYSSNGQVIPLCYKDESTSWQCDDTKSQEGWVLVYQNRARNTAYLTVVLKGLNPKMKYQMTLNGPGTGEAADVALSEMCKRPNEPKKGYDMAWECGSWGSEGFWNFEMKAKPNMMGNIKKTYKLKFDEGDYGGLKFIVKEAGKKPKRYTGPWTPVLMETETINFSV